MAGRQSYQKLIEYLIGKYQKLEKEGSLKTMPCSTCGGSAPPPPRFPTNPTTQTEKAAQMSDDNFVLVRYVHPNRGGHKVIGGYTKTFYGYRGGGSPDPFYIDRRDYEVEKHNYEIVKKEEAPEPVASTAHVDGPIEIEVLQQDKRTEVKPTDDLQLVPGITSTIEVQLNNNGIFTINDLRGITKGQLTALKGVGAARADAILKYLKDVNSPRE